MGKMRVKRLVFFLILLASPGGLISCTLPVPGEEVAVAEAGPRVWIEVPVEGLRVPMGQPVRIEGHAAYRGGITHVEIWVDGELYLVVETPSTKGNLVRFEQSWTPPSAGEYVIQAVAVGMDGVISAPNSVRLVVEAAPAGTPAPPTVLPTVPPTGLPTVPPTMPPTGTPLPSAEVSLWADRTSLTAGECTVLHWDVEHATAVFLDDAGVTGHGTRQVCPGSKTTYVLRVETPGDNTDRSVTIDVSEPPDTKAPPVPVPDEPDGGEMVDCTSELWLDWKPVSDPNGVVYYVKLQSQVKAGEWKSERGWGPESGTKVEAEVQCGGIYRWAVRAEDGAGNISAWSSWARFSVPLN
jgi:hypothetical protein